MARDARHDKPVTSPAAGSPGGVLGSIALETFRFEIGGRAWAIRAARDHAALLDLADRFAGFPFGLLLWESAPVLAEALCRRASQLAGRRVLELGCGVGFPGIVAAWLGAARVLQTDHVAEALDLCRGNAAANGVERLAQLQADWAALPDDDPYDVVIASDVLYDRASHAAFAATLERCLTPDGRVLITDPARQDTPAFLGMMAKDGWGIAQERRTSPALLPGGADTVAVDVIELTRR